MEAWSLAFSPDSRTLAVGYDDEVGGNEQTLKLWDLPTLKERANLAGHHSLVIGTAYSPNGKTLAAASYDNRLLLWDAQTKQPIGTVGEATLAHTNLNA